MTNELGLTGLGLRFALLDTGVENDHPDLDGGLVLEKCFAVGVGDRRHRDDDVVANL